MPNATYFYLVPTSTNWSMLCSKPKLEEHLSTMDYTSSSGPHSTADCTWLAIWSQQLFWIKHRVILYNSLFCTHVLIRGPVWGSHFIESLKFPLLSQSCFHVFLHKIYIISKRLKMPATQPSECTERFSQDPLHVEKLTPVMLLQGERFK